MRITLLPFCIFLLIACSDMKNTKADLVLQNAQVNTVNKNQPNAEAVAVKKGKIIFVGSNEAVKKFIGNNTEIIDCTNQFLMPGFIEGHGHIHGLGSSLVNLNLQNVKNWDEIISLVKEAVKKANPGEWIIGRGWHQEKWNPSPNVNYMGYPYHETLDKVSPNNPVVLEHASGHSSIVNANAMTQAKISSTTPNPIGGEILRDEKNEIVGVLSETAQDLVNIVYEKYLAQQSEAEQKKNWQHSIQLAEAECLRNGITSFQDAGSSLRQVQWMKDLANQNKLNLRHWLMVLADNTSLRKNVDAFTTTKTQDDFLSVKAVKIWLDGALGSHGAWLLEPYSDRKNNYGQNTFNIDTLKQIADFCWKNNLQLCVHAIGDRANRETITIYEEQIKNNKNKDHRWRIEHAQHVNPLEILRFKEWNIIASMQGIHCTSDASFVSKRLGEKRSKEGAYVWQSFLKAGVVVANGTDVPVENLDPIANFYATVTRKLKDGTTFYPDQKMSREQALYSYTLANAFAAFEDKIKGSIEVGKFADMTLLSKNLITCKDEEIKNTKVVLTIVAGKVKYKYSNKVH